MVDQIYYLPTVTVHLAIAIPVPRSLHRDYLYHPLFARGRSLPFNSMICVERARALHRCYARSHDYIIYTASGFSSMQGSLALRLPPIVIDLDTIHTVNNCYHCYIYSILSSPPASLNSTIPLRVRKSAWVSPSSWLSQRG